MEIRIILKVLLTSVVVVAISEIGKRSKLFGAVLASLPLTSLLALTWLYLDERRAEPPAALSMSIFWMVIPSLLFFPVFSWLLRSNVQFYVSLVLASIITAGGYYLYIILLRKTGITF